LLRVLTLSTPDQNAIAIIIFVANPRQMRNLPFFFTAFLAISLIILSSCKKKDSSAGNQGSLAGSWQQMNGPCNGYIESIAISGSTIYAGADQEGLHVSSDLGKSWTLVTNGIPQWSSPKATVIHNDTILASGDGLFRSTDNGNTWVQLGQAVLTCCVYNIAWSGRMIVVSTYNYGPLFISDDNGQTWTQTGGSLPADNITGVTVLGNDIFVATSQHRVFKSADNGQTFNACNNGMTNTYTAAIEAGDTKIFTGTDIGVFVSADHGANWTLINNSLIQGQWLSSLAVSGSTILTGGSDGLFYSTDDAVTWAQADIGLNKPYVESLTINGARFLAGTHSGVYLSSNSGQSWAAIGLPISFVRYFSCNGSDIFTCASDMSSGIFMSPDYGDSWRYMKNGMPVSGVYSLAWNGTDMLAATDSGVYVSADRGLTWTRKSHGLPVDAYNYVSCVAGSGTDLYAGINTAGLFVSHDGGTNWTKATVPVQAVSFPMCLFINSSGIFAGTCCYGILCSSDNGQTWTTRNTGLPDYTDVMSIVQSGARLYLATGNGVYVSSNNGNTWAVSGSELAGINVFGIATHGNDLFAATAANGIFMSTDNGNSWFQVNAGLPSSFIAYSIAVNGSWLFVGTNGYGAWRHAL
jgi:photosystem II stability/assembly factor-like uncharacterized protein